MSARLSKFFKRRRVEHEVESELRFHVDLLTEEHLRRGMTLAEAEEEALKRFGNIERIKDQCVEISRRSGLAARMLKAILVVIFAAGVLTRISSADIYGRQIGNMLIAIAALSSLLIYLRGLRFSSPRTETAYPSPLGLSDDGEVFGAGNAREFSPLEQIISE